MKGTVLGIHQTNFLPWAAWWHKVLHCNQFVLLDDVEFSKGGYINRTKLIDREWLTVPVHASSDDFISQVRIANDQARWREKHLNRIESLYRGAPRFDKVMMDLEKVYLNMYDKDNLRFFNWRIIVALAKHIHGLFPEFNEQYVYGEDLKSARDKVTAICKRANADCYISGSSGPKYMDLDILEDSGIKVYIQELSGIESIPNILDVVMFYDPKASRTMLQRGEWNGDRWGRIREYRESSDSR